MRVHYVTNKEEQMKIKMWVLIVLSSILVLGAKSCEIKDKSDIIKAVPVIEAVPEIEKLASKFDIKKNNNRIKLTTYDNLTFREAIAILKKTSMNRPVLFYKTDMGELKTEITERNIKNDRYKDIFYWYDGTNPYQGIIILFDGWWRAIEIETNSLFSTTLPFKVPGWWAENTNDDLIILTTEFCYANETVIGLNKDHGYMSIMSMLDSRKGGGSIKGDGSTPDIIVSEFDK